MFRKPLVRSLIWRRDIGKLRLRLFCAVEAILTAFPYDGKANEFACTFGVA